jgi:outer membrane protein OmpA-like peptidoglycan-associated protein
MKRHIYVGVFSLLVLALLFIMPRPAGSQEGQIKVLETKVLDLTFTVQDMGGKVQDVRLKETKSEIRIELAADVLFDFDKADILPKAREALKQAAEVIREKAKGVVQIEGHTDSKGSDAYNQKLSERRANAVRDWLANKEGLKNVRFATRGFGAKKPVAPNTKPDGSDDPEGRQKNRRVEIIVKK